MKRHFLKGRLLSKFNKKNFHNAIKNCSYFIPPAGYGTPVFCYEGRKLSTISKKPFFTSYPSRNTLLLGCIFFLVGWGRGYGQSQPHRITGTVISATDGSPLEGATVKLKGGVAGTRSRKNGSFVLIAAVNSGILVVTFIGYQTQELDFGPDTKMPVTIKLAGAGNELEEVEVNAGYYNTDRKLSTGSISRVTAKTISQQPVGNPLAALIGRVPGLEITQGTGTPGGGFNVRIRGTNSIGNGNNPLYVVNGVPFNSQPLSTGASGIMSSYGASPLNAINPSDILSIDVLKDADATAIYGSRGANGVILITTKQGKAGPTQVNATVYTGIGQVAHQVDLLNTQQYLEMRREAFNNDDVTPTISNAPDLLLWDTTRYTDWQKELLGGTAHTTDAQLSFSGGSEQTQFLLNGGLRQEGTIYPGDNGERRIAFNSNINHSSANGRFKLGFTANYSNIASNLFNTDLTLIALTTPPDAPPLYTPEGELNWENSTWINPLGYSLQDYWSNSENLGSNILIKYRITKNLDIQLSTGYNKSNMNSGNSLPLSSIKPTDRPSQQNRSNFADRSFSNWILEPQVNWNSQLGKGNLSALLGSTLLGQETNRLDHMAQGYTDEALMRNITQAPSITVSTDNYTQYRYVALYGRLNYNYLDRYLLNLTGRRDGSSRFGPDKRYANFGAVGMAWVFLKEQWLKNAGGFLSTGKLRGSYGLTGNDQLGDYLFLDTYGAGGKYQGIRGIGSGRLTNPELEWEANHKLEGAIELGFMRDRLLVNVNYYHNRSSNQLLLYTLPPTTGFANIQRNLPATIQNKGWEFEVSSTNIRHRSFQWVSSFNLSIPRNKLLSYPGLASSSDALRYVIGESLNVAKLYHYLGIDPETGASRYEDTNQDGMINKSDQQRFQYTGQLFTGGLQNSFNYGRFEMTIFFQFVRQKGFKYTPTNPAGVKSNKPTFVMDRWQEKGDIAAYPKFTQALLAELSYGNYTSNDGNIGDNSYLRLKNISCSYDLPTGWSGRLMAKNVKIFIQGQNVLTWTSYKGLDPESPESFLPPLRTLTIGLNATI